MKESPVLHHSLLALSEAGHLAMRNNTGVGWTGSPYTYYGKLVQNPLRVTKPTTVTLMPGDVLIRRARPLRAGLMVGGGDIVVCRKDDGRFGMVECKSETGRQSKDQRLVQTAVIEHGGIYGVARSPEESLRVIEGG